MNTENLDFLFDDHFHDECGVFGIYNNSDSSRLTYLGLHALQHRGQESAGIATFDNERNEIFSHIGIGLVKEVFKNESLLKSLKGNSSIGHVRYSTSGEPSSICNAQPFVVSCNSGQLACAHNGNIINVEELKNKLPNAVYRSTSDTEIILHLIANTNGNVIEKLLNSLPQVKGAYSLVFLTNDSLIAVRDPNGFRPLCIGKKDDSFAVASETTALDLVDFTFIREVEPGEVIVINSTGIQSFKINSFKNKPSFCIFEKIYFAKPDSTIDNNNVYAFRENMGRFLAKEDDLLDVDMVIGIPDSGIPAAIGYSIESKIPYRMGFIRSHFIGRTFIEPLQEIRNLNVKLKLNPIKEVINNKRIIVVDDSIVRGTTSKILVKMLKNAGAKEVHLRISSPPVIGPCYFGIDTPTEDQLLASNSTIEEMENFIDCDSLKFLSLEGLLESVKDQNNHCAGCFTGQYPIPVKQLLRRFAEKQLQ